MRVRASLRSALALCGATVCTDAQTKGTVGAAAQAASGAPDHQGKKPADIGTKDSETSKDSGAAPEQTDGKSPAIKSPNQKGAGPPPTASGTPLPLGPTDPAASPVVRVSRPRIGVALAGGGALALTEIGVLQWFEKHHIPVDMIAGTSMGALVGAMYATGQTPKQMQDSVTDDVVDDSIYRIQPAYAKKSFRRREDGHELPNAITAGLRHGVSFRNSILTDNGLNAFLVREFVRYDDQTEFNDLPIPFRCVATDLGTAQVVTFARGSIPNALRASVSIPGLYQPFAMNGHEYVDGAVLENLPTPTVRAMRPDVVLAVSLPLLPLGKDSLDSILGVFQRSFGVAVEGNEREARKLADVVILPDLKGYGSGDYKKVADLAARGYQAAEDQRDVLLKYAVSDAEWNAYVTARSARMRGQMGPVLRVTVKAPTESAQRAVERSFAPLVNQPLDIKKVEGLLADVRSDGRYEVEYTVGYESHESVQPIVLVAVTDKVNGPPFLALGGNIQAQTGGITRANIEAIAIHQDLGGYGSELRTKVQVGFGTELQLEYYRRLSYVGLFVAPRGGLSREPFYIYSGSTRVSERLLEKTGGGGDIGWSNGRTMELRAGWEGDDVRWKTDTGTNDGLPDYFAPMQRARARFVFDTQDRALVPQYGLRLVSEAAYLYDTPGSVSAPQLSTQVSFAQKAGKKNLVVLSGDGGTMLNRDVAQPFRFMLGGPYRLSASELDQYRGTEYFLVQPAYLRRVAQLPALLGQSIYAGGIYEGGEMRAPDSRTIFRQDFSAGLVAETPLGVITVAPVVGTGDHWRLVFTLGRLF